jgi:hypothetical protein
MFVVFLEMAFTTSAATSSDTRPIHTLVTTPFGLMSMVWGTPEMSFADLNLSGSMVTKTGNAASVCRIMFDVLSAESSDIPMTRTPSLVSVASIWFQMGKDFLQNPQVVEKT